MVAAPSPTMATRIQQLKLAWNFVWNNAKIHPAREIAMLPKSKGGINMVDVELQVSTYAASLFQHAFNNPDKVWAKHLLYQQAKSCKRRTFWNALTVRTPTTKYGYHPKAALRAWKEINKNSPTPITFLSYLSFKELKQLVKPLPDTLTPQFEPKTLNQPFTWNQVFNRDLPPKIQEILWRAAHNAQPNKGQLYHINPAKYTNLCDLCVGYEETSEHMFSKCAEVKTFMDKVQQLTQNSKNRQKRYMMGIAYQAIWYAHMDARIADRIILPGDIHSKYVGLLKYYKSRTQKNILRAGWPSETTIASLLTPRLD